MSLFQPLLAQQGVVILDGALATVLEHRGADLKDPLWSAKILLEQPDLIRQLHYDYFVAGANVAITASYQASFAGLAARGLAPDHATALMQHSIHLAQQARTQYLADLREHEVQHEHSHRSPSLFVAASVGPYGAYLHDGSEYHGDYGLTVAQLMDWHRPRLAVLAASGADLLACETIPSLAEGEALMRLLAEFPTQSAWLSFSCCDGAHVCHGERFADCVALANTSPQIVAVGVNCTAPRYVEALLMDAARVTQKLLVAYPNRGEQWDAGQQCWLPAADSVDFITAAERWYAAGARLIGGCCRTTPSDIAVLARLALSRPKAS
ncbi:MAG: homocysteine S-methyltransferase [Caldilineaceae bacterium]|nr:homocysteine S-methyltransferase [Caldilineaceae bacterium]